MKALILALTLGASTIATTACGPRTVEVKTGAQPVSEVSLRVVNGYNQPVNVYVVNSGSDIFLKQVAANSTEAMNVPGIAAGTTVKLRAVPSDGSAGVTRDNVTLSGVYEWRIP